MDKKDERLQTLANSGATEHYSSPDVQVNVNSNSSEEEYNQHDPYSDYYITDDHSEYDPGNYNDYRDADYSVYNTSTADDDEELTFSPIRFLLLLIGFVLVGLIIFALLAEFGVVKTDKKPSEWLGISKSNDSSDDSKKEDTTSSEGYDDCKSDGGEVKNTFPKQCVKDGVVYFQNSTESEVAQNEQETSGTKDGFITLEPKKVGDLNFDIFVVGDSYDYQNRVTAYSYNIHKTWSSYAYMVINNSDLKTVSSTDKQNIKRVRDFVESGASYNTQPYLFDAFRIGDRELNVTYLLGEVSGVDYQNTDSVRAVYALDGGGTKSMLVVRVFATKGNNVIMLEENFDTNENKEIAEKYYSSCITELGSGNSSKDCYTEKLEKDTDFQAQVKEMAEDLIDTFEI